MYKIVVLLVALFALSTTFVVAAPVADSANVTKTRIIQATQDTSLTYGGIKVFVPAGQTVILSQAVDGTVILKGKNLTGVKLDKGTVTVPGLVILSISPRTHVITVNRGNGVLVTDGHGRMAELSRGASVSVRNIRVSTVPTVVSTSVQTQGDVSPLPSFIAQTTSAASEQAAQDVEETLSPFSPR